MEIKINEHNDVTDTMENNRFYGDYSVDIENKFQNTLKFFNDWILENIKTLYDKEKVEDLTENEIFSLAYHAGVKTNWFMVNLKDTQNHVKSSRMVING